MCLRNGKKESVRDDLKGILHCAEQIKSDIEDVYGDLTSIIDELYELIESLEK